MQNSITNHTVPFNLPHHWSNEATPNHGRCITVMGFYCIDWFSFAYFICGLYFLHNTLFQKAWCLTVCSLKNVNFIFGQQDLFCCCWLDSNAFMCRHIHIVNAHILMPTVICRCRCKTLEFLNMSLCLRRCVAGSKWDCVSFMDRRCRHRQALNVFCFGALRSLLLLFAEAGVLLASSGSDLHLALDQLTVEREVAGMRIN